MNEKNDRKIDVPTKNSAVEQVKEMKELLDMGIISLDEFEIKKKELLGL